MVKFSQGIYEPINLEKYIGIKKPIYRSSWELVFMTVCDKHPSIKKWASESVKILYKHPFTGRMTVYVPDFLVYYEDKNGKSKTELIEIKPLKQTTMEKARGIKAKAVVAINKAKWAAAQNWAKKHGIVFRVMTEADMFAQVGKVKK